MEKSIMRGIVVVFLLLISLKAISGEYAYKELYLDIPDGEVTGGGIANIPPYDILLLRGEGWGMGFGDAGFMKNCLSILKDIDNSISCEEQDRIQMLDNLIKENSQVTGILFSSSPNEKINRQEFKKYILYSSGGLHKYSIAVLVEKKTGKTIEIKGKFSAKHLKWLRLEPL